MPSPFPGMNPYLEREGFWTDFHESYVIALRAALVPQIRPNYIAIIEQNVYVHEGDGGPGLLLARPDAAVVDPAGRHEPGGTATASLAAPAYVDMTGAAVVVDRESFVVIQDRESRRVVTVVEVLSPANKRPGEDRAAYLAKRLRYLKAGVNLVEIDLLRGWPRMPMRNLPPCDYCVLVSRRADWPDAGVWPILLRDRLPEVPVPLGDADEPARLDLQAVLHQVYDAVGYEDYVYRHDPTPSLRPDDRDWAAGLVPVPHRRG